ncbi:MAG: aldo/keto reductase [Aminipila sp.]
MKQTFITLNNGCRIPQFGIGVYMITGDTATEQACAKALELGYRHIDTAHAYQNERGVGTAVKKSGIPREEVWITSKLWPNEYGEGKTMEGIDKMLKRLDTDYIDLLLLHQQIGDYLGAWKDMEKAVKLGKVRSIGISNFELKRLEKLCETVTIKPAVLQVECHPYYPQNELKAFIEKYGTVLESWYPLGHANKKLLQEEVITEIAKKHEKTNAQIILRWHIEEGNIVFPKSENPVHLKENINIFDFELTQEERNKMKQLNTGKSFFNVPLWVQNIMFRLIKPAD